jgi:hypothetical protein
VNRQKLTTLAVAAVLLLAAGIWLNANRARQQTVQSGERVFPDLAGALAEVDEIRISRGDGSRTTLKRQPEGWTVAERNYPADSRRVRDLAFTLANLAIVERKTSDPANYSKLGVEAADTPTATSTLVEVVAGKKSWPLIVGKNAEGSAVYVRKPAEAASALAEPTLGVDPDQKRWIDRLLTDIPAAQVHDISVQPAKGPAYLLKRGEPHGHQRPGGCPQRFPLRRRAYRTRLGPGVRGPRHVPHLRRPGIRVHRPQGHGQGVCRGERAP